MLILIVILLLVLVVLQTFMAAVYFERDRRTFREVREDRKIEETRRAEQREKSKAELEHERLMREVEQYDGTVRKR